MEDFWNRLMDVTTSAQAIALMRAIVTAIVGLLAARLMGSAVGRLFSRRATPQQTLIARRITTYGIVGLTIASTLRAFNIDLSVLLGAAGVLTVAVGFASQTSASNFISGLFLMAERPFVLGDVIQVDDKVGEVVSIDLLSVKIRTFDNLLVRLPNETLLKSQITNSTQNPIRRVDLQVGVAYETDIARMTQILLEVADAHPLCLDEPKPLIIFLGFGESSMNFQFSLWAARDNFLAVKNQAQELLKRRFDEEKIRIPYPHRTVRLLDSTQPNDRSEPR